MKAPRPPALWELRVGTVPSGEESVAALLGAACGQPAVCATNLLTGRSRVSVYVAAGQLPDASARAEIQRRLRQCQHAGVPCGPLRLARVRREDWAESWKRHFPPLEIGRALLVRPSWSRRHGRRGQAVVTLDPGLSFGTGQHATTAFCLGQLVAARQADVEQSCLDVGTGSGILALAAARLGYAPVKAFDFDPFAVRVARANVAANGLTAQLRPRVADVRRMPVTSREQYDVVCANLLADLLIEVRATLVGRLAPGGRLVVAGILREEFAAVQAAFVAAGLRLVASRAEKEWRSGAFEWGKRRVEALKRGRCG
jgi:ribosomal protein L11 methyltransferase